MVLAPWSQLDAEAVLSLVAQACLEQLDRHRLRHPARLHRYKRSWYRDPARSPAASKPQLAHDGCVVRILMQRACRLDFLGVLVPPCVTQPSAWRRAKGDAGRPTGLGHLDSPAQGLEILFRPDC